MPRKTEPALCVWLLIRGAPALLALALCSCSPTSFAGAGAAASRGGGGGGAVGGPVLEVLSSTARAGRSVDVSALPATRRSRSTSRTTTSVKVPPMSIPISNVPGNSTSPVQLIWIAVRVGNGLSRLTRAFRHS